MLLRIGEVRSLLPKATNIMALTATATTKLRVEAAGILGMKNPVIVSRSPYIMYSVAPFTTIQETFHPIAERLRRDKSAFPRIIILLPTV